MRISDGCRFIVILAITAGSVCGADFRASFNSETPAARAAYPRAAAKLELHRRDRSAAKRGSAGELLRFSINRQQTPIRIEIPVSPARLLDELTCRCWIRSSLIGPRAELRIVFPGETDPRTGGTLRAYIPGDAVSKMKQWQQLSVATSDVEVRRVVQLLRRELRRPSLSAKGAYVEAAAISFDAPRGKWEVAIDELQMGPIVAPDVKAKPAAPRNAAAASAPRVELRLDRLSIDGKPIFPRFIPHHGEEASLFGSMHINVPWVSDWEDSKTLAAIREQHLWAMATPPRVKSSSGGVLTEAEGSLKPFDAATDAIALWYPGTAIPTGDRAEVQSWVKQIRAADRGLRRPITADVAGLERVYSRHLSMLSCSRHVVHSDFSFLRLREWLKKRSDLARPGAFLWTWVQVEPSARITKHFESLNREKPFVEPEQIRLQVYAAIAAGCRGVGFWKTKKLSENDRVGSEQVLAIREVCQDLAMLEPFLATGTLDSQVSFKPSRGTPHPSQPRNPQLRTRTEFTPKPSGDKWEAAVIRGRNGVLILPIWYGQNAHFVPGPMTARNVELVVSGISESASAWIVTPTRVQNIKRQRVAGGLRIVLPRLDMTAAILLTSKPAVIADLQRAVRKLAKPAAQTAYSLAVAKWDRVQRVEELLAESGTASATASARIAQAKRLIESAQTAFDRGDYHLARNYSLDARAALRAVQLASWKKAVARISHPTAVLAACCYQTLPSFWRLQRRLELQKQDWSENLLPTGGFENATGIKSAGWAYEHRDLKGVAVTANLDSSSRQGRNCLQLRARTLPRETPPAHIPHRPIRVASPAVAVKRGDLVRISGWVRVLEATSGNFDGVTVSDSLTGAVAALRWHRTSNWQRFTILREVSKSGPMQVAITLNSLGMVRVDGLSIHRLPAP